LWRPRPPGLPVERRFDDGSFLSRSIQVQRTDATTPMPWLYASSSTNSTRPRHRRVTTRRRTAPHHHCRSQKGSGGRPRALYHNAGSSRPRSTSSRPSTEPARGAALQDARRVTQEAYGYLCVHYAIRCSCTRSPKRHAVPTVELHACLGWRAAPRRRTRVFPLRYSTMRAQAASELLFEILPARRMRSNPRTVKRKMSNYMVTRPSTASAYLPNPRSGS